MKNFLFFRSARAVGANKTDYRTQLLTEGAFQECFTPLAFPPFPSPPSSLPSPRRPHLPPPPQFGKYGRKPMKYFISFRSALAVGANKTDY